MLQRHRRQRRGRGGIPADGQPHSRARHRPRRQPALRRYPRGPVHRGERRSGSASRRQPGRLHGLHQANTFLASGHPAPGAGGPGNRGLIESTDAGKTWKTRSLAGEADFHALDYADGTVYGYDSTGGLLRVSKDGTTWENRARLEALDIAVNPISPGTVLATTADGVAKSTDGGKTFTAGKGPVMAFVSWAKPDALYAIDPTGGLNRSTDGGITWKKTATVPGGQPQALTAVDARRILAATQDGVYESRDSGKTFTKRLAVSDSTH
ncbi:F510_1955 family glycosylhydrolase [Streptomyces sp. A3M-1-3]|uniref:F510_1955 family glycosylhydrolase n=1 Tax=Streptomyces sp. A3M-1-3 TaxID=2962044 RepID=UPI0027E587EE|nr:exo-alpha-sialidase [Streptomyces sp. A3M-1-3]